MYTQFFRYVIKMDDDISVDFAQLQKWLRRLRPPTQNKNRILGMVQYRLPVQRSSGWKWSLSRKEFVDEVLPDFVAGWAYVTTRGAVTQLVKAAPREPMLWIDDVWITGILAARAGIGLVPLNDQYTVYSEHLACCNHLPEDTVCPFAVGPADYDLNLMAQFYQRVGSCCDRECQRVEKAVITKNCSVANPLFLPEHPGIGEVF